MISLLKRLALTRSIYEMKKANIHKISLELELMGKN